MCIKVHDLGRAVLERDYVASNMQAGRMQSSGAAGKMCPGVLSFEGSAYLDAANAHLVSHYRPGLNRNWRRIIK